MNTNQFEGNWEQLKGKVRTQWGKLTEDDVQEIQGRKQTLVGKIQERYGDASEAAHDKVNTFLENLNEKL